MSEAIDLGVTNRYGKEALRKAMLASKIDPAAPDAYDKLLPKFDEHIKRLPAAHTAGRKDGDDEMMPRGNTPLSPAEKRHAEKAVTARLKLKHAPQQDKVPACPAHPTTPSTNASARRELVLPAISSEPSHP